MDYASDIELEGAENRKRRAGGLSFLIVLIGTACLVAAWILSAADPYGDLAHRVVEVRTPDEQRTGDAAAASGGPVGLLPDEDHAAEGATGLLPDVAAPAADGEGAAVAENEAFRQVIDSLPKAGGSHPVEVDRTALRPVVTAAEAGASGADALPDVAGLTVPVEEFAEPPSGADATAETGEVELTRAQRRAVQRRLGMAGHEAGSTDGVFGPMTREAIAAYQEAAGLEATGELDAATLEALRAETDADYVAWAESRRASASSRSARNGNGGGGDGQVSARRDCVRDAAGNVVGGGAGCVSSGIGGDLNSAYGGGPRDGAGFQPGSDR